MSAIQCLCGLEKELRGTVAVCAHCDTASCRPFCPRCAVYDTQLKLRIKNAL
jgi:Fe-S-cluster-containing hydrogenase component 2